MLYPRPVLAAALHDDPALYQVIWEALSSIDPKTLTGEGRVYGGGLHKLEPKELANVPIDALVKVLPEKRLLKLNKQLELFAV